MNSGPSLPSRKHNNCHAFVKPNRGCEGNNPAPRGGEKARKGMEKPINVKLTAGKIRLER